MVLKYGQLRNTHPRIGRAAYGRWIEYLTSEDWDGKQVVELLRHDEKELTCFGCGGRAHTQLLVERILVGANRGLVVRSRSTTCLSVPSCGSTMVNSG